MFRLVHKYVSRILGTYQTGVFLWANVGKNQVGITTYTEGR